MNQALKYFNLSASALAVCVFISACGGGAAEAPPNNPPPVVKVPSDTVPPTVSITDNVAAATATGPVTFTFTFSEDVGTSFELADIVVAGGSAGALTKVDATNYTLVVTPTANARGTMSVAIAVAKSTDAAGNGNAAPVTAQKAYSTILVTPAPASGNTGTCLTSPTVNCFGFQESSVVYEAFEGLSIAEQANDPVDPLNKVGKLIKVPAGQPWAGATIYTTVADKSMPIVGLANNKVVTLRMYSPAAGIPIMLKLENAANGALKLEKTVNTTVANGWETLSFDYTNLSEGVYSAATTYNKMSLFPNFLVAETSSKAYYFDELKYSVGVAAVAAGTSNLVKGVFADNYTGASEAAWASAQGGSAGRYIDSSVATQDWWSGVASPTETVRSFYFGYGISSAAKPWGFGGYVKAPANGTANVSAFTSVNVSVWGNDELFSKNPNVTLILKGLAAAGCTPELQGNIAANTIGVKSYVVAKSSLTVKTACGTLDTTDSIWAAGVNEVHFQVLGTNVQYVTGTAPDYANGLNIGPIIFQ